ncbi:MAG: 3-oxoacyl-ACP reductase family protein [Nitrososphaeria archaeon]
MSLFNKIALVTGGSRGIGRAIALGLAKEGANVAINYSVRKDKADEVVNLINKEGRRALAIQVDVSKQEAVNEMVGMVIKEFGRIDILVNNAGVFWKTRGVLEAEKEQWERLMGINLYGIQYCVQAVAPYMIKQRYGKVINISSIAGIGISGKRSIAYEVSKAAVIMLTKKLADELGEFNINVNAIAPGYIDTDLLRDRSEESLKELFERVKTNTALRRVGTAEEVANLAVFLASDKSSFITGQVIVIDGGRRDYFTHSV